nr:immunoglobulin heavy chain junction region [Mus musculus]
CARVGYDGYFDVW